MLATCQAGRLGQLLAGTGAIAMRCLSSAVSAWATVDPETMSGAKPAKLMNLGEVTPCLQACG